MNLSHFTTCTKAARTVCALRHLRKVKVYPSVRSVTMVTYFKHQAPEAQYVGRAHIVDLASLQVYRVSLAHTAHSPPSAREDQEDAVEQEVESPPPSPQPAIGFQLLTV